MRRTRLPGALAVGVVLLLGGSSIAPATPFEDRLADARDLLARQEFAQAESAAGDARALAVEIYGSGAVEIAAANDVLVTAQHALGRGGSEECLDLARESVDLKAAGGADAADLERSRRLYGLTLLHRQDLEASQSVLRAVADFWAERPAENAAEAARAERDLGACLASLGEDEEACSRLARAAELAREGTEDDLVPFLYNYARVLARVGDSTAASASYAEAIEIESERSEVRAIRAFLLNGLAILLYDQEEFTAAQENFEEAIDAARVSLPPGHPFVALTENNLGNLLREVGEYEGAARAYTAASEALEQAYGRDHTYVAMALANLGTVRLRTGQPDEALRLHTEALEIRRNVFGDEHPEVATSHLRLAEIQLELGHPDDAATHAARALEIRSAALAPGHSETAIALVLRARILLSASDPAGARLDLETALADLEAAFGPVHPECAEARRLLAVSHRALGNPTIAMTEALHAESIARDHGRIVAATMSERLALRHASVRTSGLDVALSLLEDTPQVAVAEVWDALIRSRALVLDETMFRRQQMAGLANAGADSLFNAFLRQGRELATLLVEGPSGPTYAEDVRAATGRRERTERALAQRSSGLPQATRRLTAGLDDVRSALPAGSTLVSYVRFVGEDGGHAVPRYAAFVLHPDSPAAFFPLGEAEAIDDAIATWRAAVVEDRPVREVARALATRVWSPIARAVEPAELVFLVPDANLNQVAFATLSGEDWLLESAPPLHLLAAERDLVARSEPAVRGSGLLAVGGPDFGTPAAVGAAEPEGWFAPLPEAFAEAQAIVAMWKDGGSGDAILLTGADATETRFKRESGGRRVVHLATHGFVIGEPEAGAAGSGHRGIGGVSVGSTSVAKRPRPGLSGLAFAAANLPVSATDEDDGILTSLEIATLDLHAAEWVVLSACDTGVGTAQAGEGVLGLRRSFEAAGAGTLVMSLWPVEDEVARIWMEELYDAHFARGLCTAQAARAAGLATMEWEKRERGRDHPSAWGSFVAVGDWR